MSQVENLNIPAGWNVDSHRLWLRGNKAGAIQNTVTSFNASGDEKPVNLVLQLAYYLFLINNYRGAVKVLEQQYARTPRNPQVVLNLAVSYSRMENNKNAANMAKAALLLQPDNVTAYDILAGSLFKLGNLKGASVAGAKSLELKDRAAPAVSKRWQLPSASPDEWLKGSGKKNVIAFSLWGSNPRYLRGAVRNLLLAPEFYPGWELWFYMDSSVPAEFIKLVRKLGGKITIKVGTHSLRQKLCWRFLAANDPAVGRFLVRDADSVFGSREALAVHEWLQSDRWFHVIRDWWTHTDLVLAGTWGGISGVLPPLEAMLAQYAPAQVETPNIDQWFLRDRVWSYMRQSCLVHDRCFKSAHSHALPALRAIGNYHIGQDEFAVRRDDQERFLGPWIEKYPCLGLPSN